MSAPIQPQPTGRVSPTAPRRGKHALDGLTAALLAPGLAACSPGALPRLTVPVAPWVGSAYLQLAEREGLDRAAGLQLRIVPYDDPQRMAQAWLRGEYGMAPLSTVEVVALCSRRPDRCPVVVLVLDESRGADKLIVRRSISNLGNLRGRRVGVAPSSLGPFLTSRALESVGLDIAQVRLVPMPSAALGSALNNGRIDAATAYPPFSDLMLQLGIGRVAFDSAAIPGQILDLLVVDPVFLEQNRQALARLLVAWQWSHAKARRDPEATVGTLAALLKTSPTGVRRSEDDLGYFPLERQGEMLAEGGAVATALAAVQEVQEGLGMVRQGAPLPQVSDAVVRRALQLAASSSAPK
jgi:NitT/TauT family transport system substrate-binding protein